MANMIESIGLARLIAHPDNANVMSRAVFNKLVRNIERSGRYEPLVVRRHPKKKGCFEIINGHHRCKALEQLGYEEADCVVWDVDDEQVGVLLATLNRLVGADSLSGKIALLKRLNKKMSFGELGKLLPQTAGQLERLANLKRPAVPKRAEVKAFAHPLIFFVSDAQRRTIEEGLSLVSESGEKLTRAAKKAAGRTQMARSFIEHSAKMKRAGESEREGR